MHLGDVLDAARRRSFVGRGPELAGFDDALEGRSTSRVLFVHGQGGIGKTTLLLEFRARARAAGRTVVQLDGREVDPSPEGLWAAVQGARGEPEHGQPIPQPLADDVLLAGDILLVDDYDQLAPIDGWLRNDFMPRLPADSVVVLAGRNPPAAPWRTDSGWRHLVAVHHLDHFDALESGQLLAHAGVAPGARPHLVTLGHGHPLTMALLAELAASGDAPTTLADAPDLISALLESFLRDAPSEAHLTGLAACAIAWLTTEDLLYELIGTDAGPVWQWLARRPFVTISRHGLFVHDLARDVLNAEFERRSPALHRSYRRVVRDHAIVGLRAATGLDRQRNAQQLLFVLRNTPLTSAFYALRAQGSAAVIPARADEHDDVCSIINRFEGQTSADLARAWLTEQPEHLSVVRVDNAVAAFAYHLLCPSGSAMEDRDPVVRAILEHVAEHGPTRPGERVDILRFIGGARDHQRDLYAVLTGPVSSLVEWLARPLAWSFIVAIDTDYWAAYLDYLAFAGLVELDVGGLRHVAYGIDWRRLPVDVWLDLLYEREHSGEAGPPPAALMRPPPLGRARFGEAVRAALQTLHRPDQLAANPLLGSALAATATDPSADQLRATIEVAIACLGSQPKGEQLQAVLYRTYLRGTSTQEAAAEVLDLPFSTYRRYLAKALEQLTDLLWTVEIGDVRLPRPDRAAGRVGDSP
jgi:hypothetical protein